MRQRLLKEMAKELEALSLKAFDKREGILLIGSEENVQKAGELISAHLDESSNNPLVTETISVPQSLHGVIVGRGGETIKKIRKDTGCEIRIPPSFKNIEDIELSGSAEAIALAKAAIQQVISDKNI